MTDDTSMTITIFGGTGDLAQKKLFTALLDLYVKGHLPETFRILGFSREEYSHEDYRSFVKEALEKKGHEHDKGQVEMFLQSWYFKQGDLLQTSSYQDLKECLDGFDDELGRCPNRLFYLAVSPGLYDPVFENVASVGLNETCENGWTRLLVEKPFGRDLQTAQKLDKKLGDLYEEEQIYRIDHYLAKDMVQNLIAFRFSNTLFENSWNSEFIEAIYLKLYEDQGIEGRGSFYSATGALRDVGQNHMLQLLALLTMNDPGNLTATALGDARFEVLDSLRVDSKDVIRAQYDGYKEVEGVEGEGCTTETYFALKATIDSDRWANVPIYLESGKGLREDLVEIEVHFKRDPSCICGNDAGGHRNVLTLTLQPEKKVNMTFWSKKPGLTFDLERKDLSFDFLENDDRDLPDAYEKVLFDAIEGDQTLFVSTKEVEVAWTFIMTILNNWNDHPLYSYQRGGDGPEERLQVLREA